MERTDFLARMRECQLDGVVTRRKAPNKWVMHVHELKIPIRLHTSHHGSRIKRVQLATINVTRLNQWLEYVFQFPDTRTWQGRKRSLALLRRLFKEGIPPTAFFRLAKGISRGEI